MYKKITILLISTLMVFSLTSCSNNEDSGIKVEGNTTITIDVNKTVDNVDSFVENITDSIINSITFN